MIRVKLPVCLGAFAVVWKEMARMRGNGLGGGIGRGCDFSGGCEEKGPETGGAVPQNCL